MADDTPNGQAPEGNEASQAPAVQESKTFDEAYVKQLRSEAAKWRKEAQDASAKVQTFEQQQMTEAQRAKAEADAAKAQALAAQTELRKARAETAIAREAIKYSLDPALLAKLVEVDFDEEGAPQNVPAAVEAVLKAYPQLKPATQATATTNPGRGVSSPKLTMADVKRMTEAQILARWEEVSAVLEGK